MLYYKKCVVEYDGACFSGWQRQNDVVTVQEELEKALTSMYKTKITVVGSGRTDAGVHAIGQVFSFRAEFHINNRAVQMGLNSILPDSISIISVEDAFEGFNAQKHAEKKTYEYTILNRDYPSAIMRDRSWWVKKKLNIEGLQELFDVLVGEHDFASFCIKGSLRENTVREILEIRVENFQPYIKIYITGTGFLHMMVRLIVGTVVEAHMKSLGANHVMHVLESKDISEAGVAAPAGGLCLYQVYYKVKDV